jgi:APA family basic amino acid/polyamine antiporter
MSPEAPAKPHSLRSLLRIKSIDQTIADAVAPCRELKRSPTAWDLMIPGVVAAVGAGGVSVGARAGLSAGGGR